MGNINKTEEGMTVSNLYRVRFSASFQHIVVASDAAEARKIADELQTMPRIAITSAQQAACAWNTIEPWPAVGTDD